MQHQNKQYFKSNRGLDLKSSDLNRGKDFASSMLNAQYRPSGAPEKRKGNQIHSLPADGWGMFNYKRVDVDDQLEEIVVSVGRGLKRLYFTEIEVEYSGSEAAAYLSLFFDPVTDQYRCQITAGLTQVLDLALGKGYDEASPVTINTLATTIGALTDFTANVTGDGTVPAAFIRVIRDIDVKETPWTGKAGYWLEVNTLISNPFDGSYDKRNETDFENVSGVVIRNVLYLSNGYDFLYKYDGQNLYRAGIPKPDVPTSALGGAGAITGTNYFHRVQYVQVDAAGNTLEGNITPVAAGLSPTAQSMDVTVPNIQSGTGFNLNAAIVAGAQVSVNQITVDDGSGGQNTMKAGDTAYFYDGISAAYVERLVTARDNATITVDGDPVTVADNAVISNNLRIMIQRNYSSAITPSVFYQVVQLPNNPFTATQSYNDNLTDNQLGFVITPPPTDRSLPPKGKYITAFQNLLFVTGNPADQLKIYWSDIDSPEYFPSGVNEERVETQSADPVSGIAGGSSVLAVFTRLSTVIGSGTFGDLNYRLEEKASNIGCSSHASITFIDGFMVWWSENGPYAMAGGQLPTALGPTPEGDSRIAPVMNQDGYEFNPGLESQFFRAKRCVAFNWASQSKVLFFLPAETSQAGVRLPNRNSRVYAYDYTRDAWLEWNNIDMIGGACAYQDEIFFKGRRLSGLTSDVVSELRRFHNLNDAWDYEDNDEPIEWEYGPQWEDLGQPGILKKFLELQIYSLEDVANSSLNVTIKQEINFQKDAPVAEFNMQITGSGYGQSQYGSDPYGDPLSAKLKHELARERTYATRTVFTNSEHQQNCVISGWELLFVAPFRVEFKK